LGLLPVENLSLQRLFSIVDPGCIAMIMDPDFLSILDPRGGGKKFVILPLFVATTIKKSKTIADLNR
jgi:hypothetical protein